MDNYFKVIELFAGVGGFRLGLENSTKFKVIWSNQWEPSTKAQHASLVYEARFGKEGHSNEDIEKVPTSEIPDHDMLVAGFPCQDYSVATTLHNSKGLIGKKGVLWWSIHRILKEKQNKPGILMLENVDRLLKSPAAQRGRDFAIMLKSLDQLGYACEWRVINAADYGMPQRRRRVFILGYLKSQKTYNNLFKNDPFQWLHFDGIFSKTFPIVDEEQKEYTLSLKKWSLTRLTEEFNVEGKTSPFQNAGIMVNGKVYSKKVKSNYAGLYRSLGDVLDHDNVNDDFYLDESELDKWEYHKGGKKLARRAANGHVYYYSEGGMKFPDPLDKASRTIITGEGGKSPSRFKHVVQTPKGLRRLTPLELERLNTFPDNHTKLEGISDSKRAFFMGNALVVDVVKRLANTLEKNL
ncbi:DNA (cytosine-5-)-methyltransferase [Flagellimonas sp. S3867]|uniref:DNA (cytosine-5-)-methyltransferase n=1 Tax=Flagellimonas sp. S3867 TaxID=2768063 RepID=UPI00168A02A0|nr:DNA (cytosine-5-)-methyltransferase [Flagellimonas sp. S3867]